MRKDYLDGISIVKHFLGDIDALIANKHSQINFDFYKQNYEKLLFYISKSLISDNFDELFFNIDLGQAKGVFTNDLAPIMIPGFKPSAPSEYMNKHAFCDMPSRFSEDPKLAYKFIIRDSICHYDYEIKGDRIIIDKIFYEENLPVHVEITIASLMALMRNTLSSFGSSRNEGAYHYYRFLNPRFGDSCYYKIVNLRDNKLSPSDFAKGLIYREKMYGKPESPSRCSKYIKELASSLGSYYIKREKFDDEIVRKAGLSSVSTDEQYFLYMCAYDRNMGAGIIYDALVSLIFSIRDNKIDEMSDFFDKFYPVLSNAVFICYMSLVFDDLFSRNFNGTISSNLFIHKTEIEDKKLPWKFRNSLAHSRYYFENIFDPSEGIVIEFWDEKNGIKNFECKITKKNAEKLIDQFLSQMLDSTTIHGSE